MAHTQYATAPFNLPEPIVLLNEICTEGNAKQSFGDKCLGLWKLDEIEV